MFQCNKSKFTSDLLDPPRLFKPSPLSKATCLLSLTEICEGFWHINLRHFRTALQPFVSNQLDSTPLSKATRLFNPTRLLEIKSNVLLKEICEGFWHIDLRHFRTALQPFVWPPLSFALRSSQSGTTLLSFRTIHTLLKHIFRLFFTPPFYSIKNIVLQVTPNCHFLPPFLTPNCWGHLV